MRTKVLFLSLGASLAFLVSSYAWQAADGASRQEKEALASRIAVLENALAVKDREVETLKLATSEVNTEKELEIKKVMGTYEDLIKEMQQEIDKGDIKITQAVDRLSVNLVEKILFDSGSSELKPEGLKVIKRVGDILKGASDRQIRVEGHTDNVQIGSKMKGIYPSNWELSTARATTVVRYLQDTVGVKSSHLSAAGFADGKPVASNRTWKGKAQNRRIEIVLLPQDVNQVIEELKQGSAAGKEAKPARAAKQRPVGKI